MIGAMWNVLLELAPWLLLGLGVAAALHVLLPQDFIRRHLTGRGAVGKAVLLGVPLPHNRVLLLLGCPGKTKPISERYAKIMDALLDESSIRQPCFDPCFIDGV